MGQHCCSCKQAEEEDSGVVCNSNNCAQPKTPTNMVVEFTGKTSHAQSSPAESTGDTDVVEAVNQTETPSTSKKRKTFWKRLLHHRAEKKSNSKDESEENCARDTMNPRGSSSKITELKNTEPTSVYFSAIESCLLCDSNTCAHPEINSRKVSGFNPSVDKRPPSENDDRNMVEGASKTQAPSTKKDSQKTRKTFWKRLFGHRAEKKSSKKQKDKENHQVRSEKDHVQVDDTNEASGTAEKSQHNSEANSPEENDQGEQTSQAEATTEEPVQEHNVKRYDGIQENITSHYEIGSKLGEGGCGCVYEGRRFSDNLQVAIKIVRKGNACKYISFPDYQQPLPVEVALMILIQQGPSIPEIIQMIDWYDEPQRYIIILERPPNCVDMARYIKDHGHVLRENTARIVMWQAVQSACLCNERGVFHRDIKLENLLVNEETMEVKLIDFGCGDKVNLNGYDNLSGTESYLAPEVYLAPRYHAEPTTVWSLGVLLFKMLCDQFPRGWVLNSLYSRTFELSHLSEEVLDLLCSCMQFDPNDRIPLGKILEHDWFKETPTH